MPSKTIDTSVVLNDLIVAVTKTRSNLCESWDTEDGDADGTLVEMFPWIFGPKSILPKLAALQARTPAPLPAELFTFLQIANTLCPIISSVSALRGKPLPEAIEILGGVA